ARRDVARLEDALTGKPTDHLGLAVDGERRRVIVAAVMVQEPVVVAVVNLPHDVGLGRHDEVLAARRYRGNGGHAEQEGAAAKVDHVSVPHSRVSLTTPAVPPILMVPAGSAASCRFPAMPSAGNPER